jgi:arylsulfatase
MEQKTEGTLRIWLEPFTALRGPMIFNLRLDPYEHAPITSNTYYDWMFHKSYLLVPAQSLVGEFLATFKEFPPRQKASSFSLENVVATLTSAATGG